jgi:hypothetical protein
MAEPLEKNTAAWRRQRAHYKRLYHLQLSIGFPFLLIGLFSFFYVGGISGLWGEVSFLRNTESTQAIFTAFDESHYKQSGTGVSFRQWDAEFEYQVNGVGFEGRAIVNYPPQMSPRAVVYFDSTNPSLHRLEKPDVLILMIQVLAAFLPLIIAIISFILALISKRRVWRMENT